MSKALAEQRIVVIGASAGGMQALTTLIAQLPGDFPAAVCVVCHMSPEITGLPLVRELDKGGALPCRHAVQGEAIAPGMVYFAPVDQHMLVDDEAILITKGARENRSRPAIDPLFRSAAVAFGHRVIGIVLTGSLSDGTSGMLAIKRCGGICMVQDPEDAAYSDMPHSVISNVAVDHVVSIAEMGPLLVGVVGRPPPPIQPIPEDIVIEARIAARVLSDVPAVSALGDQVPFNCPDCGGVLWQIADGEFLRYRCHTGHAFTSSDLLAQQTAKIEETMWVSLRMFEERQNLLKVMTDRAGSGAPTALKQRAADSQVHIDRIRSMLMSTDKDDPPAAKD